MSLHEYEQQYHNIKTVRFYLFSKIADMDPAQNTVEDLMLRISHLESIDYSRGVCLYTDDGMPLTDDPFFNTCKSIFKVGF